VKDRREFLRQAGSAAAGAALFGLSRSAASGVQESGADLVVWNGKVLTLDARSTVAEAVAVRQGVLVQVGSNATAKSLIGRGTRVIDAQGKSVVPGLIDTHVHAVDVARAEAHVPYEQLGSIDAIQAWLRRRTTQVPPDRWITIPRIFPTRLRERRNPTREELDAAAPANPVVYEGAYAQVLNSAALRAANITRETQALPGTEIVKNARGEPTGLLRNARALIAKHLPSPPVSEGALLDGVEEVHRRYSRLGITSVAERGAGIDGHGVYQKLREQGRLRVRGTMTTILASDGSARGTEEFIRALPFRFGDGDDWVRVGPLKIVVDGGILTGTAFLREPYGDRAERLWGITDPAYRGSLTLTAEQVKTLIRTGHRLGWQMCSHVTGDAGTDLVLDAVEAADADRPIRGRRFTLTHAYFARPDIVRRAAALGVSVDTQPALYYKDAEGISSALGEERLANFIGVGSWRRGGVTVAISSDHMLGLDPDTALHFFNPFLMLYTVVSRKTEGGRVIGPSERVTREEALRMLTSDAAMLGFDEKSRGTLEVGKLGDLAVLSEDYLACGEERIREIRALATVVGGKVVHEEK